MTVWSKFSLGRNYPKISRLEIYVFLVIVLVSFICVILSLAITNSVWLDDNVIKPYVETPINTLHIIRQNVRVCLTKDAIEKRSFTVNDTTSVNELPSSAAESKESSIFTLLSGFNNLLSSVNVKGAIIEPSILHCMVQPYYQDILSKRNFNVTNISGSKNIVTYGIFGRDIAILQQEESIAQFREAGFIPYFVTAPVADWMQRETTPGNFEAETFVSHIFYNHTFYTVHVVAFYERRGYVWHAALASESRQEVPPKSDLVLVDHDGAYEKFTFFSLNSELVPLPDFYIPSTTHYFLLEMLSSRFLECNSSRALNVKSYSSHPKSHSGMSVQRFNRRTLIALHQLKSIFHPMLMNFWIWSGTMLGWYRECDIIPYTSDVDFAAWASEVEDLDLIVNLLLNNEHIQIKERMGMLDEALEFNIACHGLRTDVFFLYQIKNGSWCSGHSPKLGYYFRYYYPHFTLCSAELLGEKVLVPCETEKVILTEYGPGWNKPVSSWHYESSIKNRGPDIYWSRKKLKYSHIVYY